MLFGFLPVIPPCSSIFRFIPVYAALFVCHSGVILARFGIFRYHSCSFRLIPVSFRLVPAYSGLFWYIPFHSVPVFSNALAQAYLENSLLFPTSLRVKLDHDLPITSVDALTPRFCTIFVLKFHNFSRTFKHHIKQNP